MRVNAKSLLFVLLFSFITVAQAQEPPPTAAERAEKLRLELLEVQTKLEALKDRAQELDEALKPENIERSLAGVGSTRPEELRESRRRQLQIQRDGLEAQIKLLETSRTRLEAAILEAETRAYHDSARPAPVQEGLIARSMRSTRLLISGGTGFVVAGIVAGLYMRRRLRRRS